MACKAWLGCHHAPTWPQIVTHLAGRWHDSHRIAASTDPRISLTITVDLGDISGQGSQSPDTNL